MRDGGDAWLGKGVTKAVAHVEGEIAEVLTGRDATDQRAVDRSLVKLDVDRDEGQAGCQRDPRRIARGRESRGRRRPAALSGRRHERDVLPVPLLLNVVNGGAHAQNSLDFQEFMLVLAGAESSEALRIGAETYRLKQLLSEREGLSTAVGDEGGFAPDLAPPTTPARRSSRPPKGRGTAIVALALDPATSELHHEGHTGSSARAARSTPRG